MMRGVLKVTLVVCLALGLAGVALAQRGGGLGFGGELGILAMYPGVQKEIKVTDEQRDKLKDALAKVREDHKDDLEKLRNRNTPLEEQEKLMKAYYDDNVKAIKGVLDDKQMNRLRQIELQQRGTLAFQNSEVQSKLKLTDDQKEKIKTINKEPRQKTRDLLQGGNDREEFAKKYAELQKNTMEKITGVLTADQKKTWKEMTGEPFPTISYRDLFQPRNRN